MYLRLGTTNIKYSTSQDDFTIFSEVIDSGMSYEKPVLVRTPDELDIWFGESFTDKDYFNELLESGVTLFLYRPVKVEQNKNSDNYILLEKYTIDEKLYYSVKDLPEVGKSEVLYKVVDSSGKYKEQNLWFSYYIYNSGTYINITNLPQNLDSNNTDSLNNRDVLNINYLGFDGPEYCYPKYQENSNEEVLSYPEKIDKEILLDNLPDLLRVSKGYETLAYSLKYDNKIDFFPTDEGLTSKYIILKKTRKRKIWLDKNKIPTKKDYYEYHDILVWFKDKINSIPNIPSQYYTDVIEVNISGKNNREIFKRLVEDIIPNKIGYTVSGDIDKGYKIYTSYSIQVTNFTNIKDLNLIPDFNTTHNILSKISMGSTRIRFISKTIGSDSGSTEYLDSDIKVVIEKLREKDNYRITLERYKYQEIYEGGLFTIGKERIDSIISKESKLVRCIISNSYIDPDTRKEVEFNETDKRSELISGTWYLKRAEKEDDPGINEYWKAAESIFNSDNVGMIDYFLVPDIYKYTAGMKIGSDTSYYPEYKRFLEYAGSHGFQVLIQNSDNGWEYLEVDKLPEKPIEGIIYIYRGRFYKTVSGKLIETVNPEEINIAGNNYVFNYIEDKDNRLLYFYRPQTIFGNLRPGYYLHIFGLLQDIYSISDNQIIYQTPTKDPYTLEDIEEKLETFKSNYLVFNNHMYYYKKYQNGQDFNTSGWMRFCIGKVFRELEKNKWGIFSTRGVGNIRSNITQILSDITIRYSFIDSLTIAGFYLDLPNNRLGLEIESRMSDLVDNNMTIDITLNYNN